MPDCTGTQTGLGVGAGYAFGENVQTSRRSSCCSIHREACKSRNPREQDAAAATGSMVVDRRTDLFNPNACASVGLFTVPVVECSSEEGMAGSGTRSTAGSDFTHLKRFTRRRISVHCDRHGVSSTVWMSAGCPTRFTGIDPHGRECRFPECGDGDCDRSL